MNVPSMMIPRMMILMKFKCEFQLQDQKGRSKPLWYGNSTIDIDRPSGVTGFAGGRPKASDVVAYWPALLAKEAVQPRVTIYEIN